MAEDARSLTIEQALEGGAQYASAGDHRSAIGLYRGVLMHEPENFEAIERLGVSLFEIGQLHEAMFWFWRGRKIDRKHPMALTNYGLCLSQLGYPAEGVPDLERAIAFSEKMDASPATRSLVYNNLGNTLERLGRYTEAIKMLDKGIACEPADPFPHYNRGVCLLRLNRHKEAIAALDHSLELRGPVTDSASRLNAADAYYNRGMARLLLGDLKGGFADYEYRLLTTENKVPNLGLPADKKWNGTDRLEGKTILVHCEQGIGDDIQFFRFLAVLAMHNPRTIKVMAHSATAGLLEHTPVEVLKPGSVLKAEDYDYWAALMSLPLLLGLTAEADLPPPFLYQPDQERIDKWKATLALPSDKFNVGVCWAGNWLHKNNAHRSIDLSEFAALFDAEGCNFVSLQQMQLIDTKRFHELKDARTNLSAFWFDDLRDTAAAIASLDLVVTVDTAVAHLSGSIGVPTWILIPAFSTDWRWQLSRLDSPWYPSVRLIRQATIGKWPSTLSHVKTLLERQADSRHASRVS